MKYQIMIRKRGLWRRIIVGEISKIDADDIRVAEFLKDVSKLFERRFKHHAKPSKSA